MESLNLVPVDKIPLGQDCWLDKPADLLKLALQMEVICDREHGIGLSAVQIGVPLNFFIIRNEDNGKINYQYFLNCTYKGNGEEKIKVVEGCLSLRDESGNLRYFQVERYKEVTVTGIQLLDLLSAHNSNFVYVDFVPQDIYNIVFQHEVDHNRGVLISDIGKELFLWENK